MRENGTSYSNAICPKCCKPFCYVGDVPEGGFIIGTEPFCTCGTLICDKCGERYVPKCEHGTK